MIWLTWRQFRAQAVVTSAALAIAAVVLAVTGLQLAHLYDASGIGGCQAHGDCAALASRFQAQVNASSTYTLVDDLFTALLFVVPAIIGIFWGAPLIARELEAGTFRLAWNQSVTQTRWLAIKIGLVGLASMAAAGLLTLMLTWWATPLERAAGLVSGKTNQLEPLIFGARGIAPMGYALFAFALGVAAGVLIRRTIPAMAVTLAVFAGVQIAMALWVRPHLIQPAHRTVALTAATLSAAQSILGTPNGGVIVGVNVPGAWVLSTGQATNSAGHVVSSSCSNFSDNGCIAKLKLHELVTYQPVSRFWALQSYETAIFVVVSLLLAGFCFWQVRRQA